MLFLYANCSYYAPNIQSLCSLKLTYHIYLGLAHVHVVDRCGLGLGENGSLEDYAKF